jgi:DEAD/DEAH box helicase domain-containing protein
MREFVERLKTHPSLGSMLALHRRVEGTDAAFGELARPLPAPLADALESAGIERLYSHQAQGLDLAREGRDVLAVTPTASGKTLLFALAVLETIHADPRSKALFIYPTKALAQDQLGGLRQLAGAFGALDPPRFEIYDGDTPASRRRKIKANPPNVLITNPDMLHMGILAHHQDWQPFLRDLRWVVLDELHVYRGIFGAHVHHILARLRRLCELYGSKPRFIAASATIGNPDEFARTLVGRPFDVVSDSGAARSPLDVVFLNPVAVSPYTTVVRLVAETARQGLRTIAFTKARRITELLYNWVVQQEPALRGRVAPYRAGYLPEDRRALEARLFRGDLDAVFTTSALELGIDVGSLDACILVGYPGSLISSWQRIGRVGRQQRAGLIVMVAMPDALDQYVVHHPELFFGREFERAVLDPGNPFVAAQHLVCAAAEQPLSRREVDDRGPGIRDVVRGLADDGGLVQTADGESWFSFRRKPHRDVSPRSAGRPFTIVERRDGSGEGKPVEKLLGKIDAFRAQQECHPGAIYLHGGRSFLSHEVDEERRRVVVESVRVDYYTSVLGEKETEILERHGGRRLGEFQVGWGRLKVTVRIRGYQKRRLFGGDPISTHPLEVPPFTFETTGFWIELPAGMPAVYAERDLHFMGGIHATEHAVIGLFPLLAIAERGDVGGISYTGHPQLACPAIFVYDGVPGGAGLAERGYADLESLLERTYELIRDCACEGGCPGCIQSPQCGNGNKPLDKAAAKLTLQALLGASTLDSLGLKPAPDRSDERLPVFPVSVANVPRGDRRGIVRAGNVDPVDPKGAILPAAPALRRGGEKIMVFDLETQRSAEDVGGWGNTDRMGLALGVVYDVRLGVYRTYFEADVHRLLLDLVMADCVVGFNIDRFDLPVLSAYTDWDLKRINTLDLLARIRDQLSFRVSLNHLAEANLGESKAGDGLQSLRWWKEGRIDLIEQYCRKDVEVTHKIYELGRSQNFLLYRDHSDRMVRVPVRW